MTDQTATPDPTAVHCGVRGCGEPIDFIEGEGWFHSQVGPDRGHRAIPDRLPVRDTEEHVTTVQALVEEALRAGAKAGAEAERARIVALLEEADNSTVGSDVPYKEVTRFSEDEFYASAYNEGVTDGVEWAAKKVAIDPDQPAPGASA